MTPYRIILADDHPILRVGLKKLIDDDPKLKVVAQAKDGEELLLKLAAAKCNLVVLDLSMPRLSGMLAIQEIRRRFPKIKILILTMQKDMEHFKNAMKNGANGYLLKDDAYEQLVLAIKLVAKNQKFISSSISNLMTEQYIRSLDEAQDSVIEILTRREQEILRLIASGHPNKNIASRLKISIRTVETHRGNLTKKLGLKNTAGLVKYAFAKGLV